MISGEETRALEGALADADRTLARMDETYGKARNLLSYVGWEDEITTRGREAVEKAHAERAAIVDERNRLLESPDHEAWAGLVERARALIQADKATDAMLAQAKAWTPGGAIADEVVRPAAEELAKVAAALAQGAAKVAGKALGALPWWAYAAGGVAVLVALSPALNAAAQAAKGRKR